MKFIIEKGLDNEILRTKSLEINKNDFSKYIKLGKEMVKYIKNPDNGGVGLAAPQIGYNIRLIAVSLMSSYEDEIFKSIMMINPEILEFSDEVEKDGEGCLSVPGKTGDVIRPTKIKVRYIDDKLSTKTIILEGLSARIVQHEIDHLNGVLFVDRIIKKD